MQTEKEIIEKLGPMGLPFYNKTIASLMATYGSNYNNLFNSMFPMSAHLNELKLAEYKEMLIEKGKLTEQCD